MGERVVCWWWPWGGPFWLGVPKSGKFIYIMYTCTSYHTYITHSNTLYPSVIFIIYHYTSYISICTCAHVITCASTYDLHRFTMCWLWWFAGGVSTSPTNHHSNIKFIPSGRSRWGLPDLVSKLRSGGRFDDPPDRKSRNYIHIQILNTNLFSPYRVITTAWARPLSTRGEVGKTTVWRYGPAGGPFWLGMPK